MIKLTPLDIDEEDIFKKIARSKHLKSRTILNDNAKIIFEDYKIYEAHKNNLEEVKSDSRIEKDLKEALLVCYKQGEAVGKLKKDILENMPPVIRAKCPYCMISAPDTFEHYLDKSEYPEFSVYSKNLIPCCTQCNNLKGTKFLDENGTRMFIQFYYDDLPSDNFLKIEVKLKDGRPAIGDIYLDFKSEESVNSIIKNHFMTLKLIKRYRDQLNERLSSIYYELQSYGDYPMERVIKILKIRIIALEKEHGANYWEACLYKGILNNSHLVETICGNVENFAD